jgi:mannose-6-phosphate isomerase-like protein (cupin superfamily)
MQTRPFPPAPEGRSPAGVEIRYMIEGETGGMIDATVPPGQVNRATVHATVSDFWHAPGQGEMWRRDDTSEETTVLAKGASIDIPVGAAFQYRCTGIEPLRFLCVTMPPGPATRKRRSSRGRGNRLTSSGMRP